MESSLYVAVAAQKNLDRQLTVVANNLANANTVGFRAESVDFKSLVSTTPEEPVHFPQVAGLHAASEQGTLVETGNPLDLAISGDGWFAISTPQGTAYTRDGRLTISPFGEVQSIEGYPVLDSGEAPIQVDTRFGPPQIEPDGRILSNGRLVGNVGLFMVEGESLSGRFSNSAFFSSVPGTPVAAGDGTKLVQGHVENSNVNPLKELANLMTITKQFESATALMNKADDTLSRSISELAGR